MIGGGSTAFEPTYQAAFVKRKKLNIVKTI
jgi:hypothetical protein